MSLTFILSDKSSILSSDFNPPIYLDTTKEWVMGMTNFETFNSIPNVTEENNVFKIGQKAIHIPTGSYEIADIAAYINSQLNSITVSIEPNHNTLKTMIRADEVIDFSVKHSIGPLLGFKPLKLKKNERHESDVPINIIKVNSLLITCNITTGNYVNGIPNHVIHQFFPSVPAGFKIIEAPDHVPYLPINVNTITNITLKIVDQDGDLVNFRGETVTIGLHLKSISDGVQV